MAIYDASVGPTGVPQCQEVQYRSTFLFIARAEVLTRAIEFLLQSGTLTSKLGIGYLNCVTCSEVSLWFATSEETTLDSAVAEITAIIVGRPI